MRLNCTYVPSKSKVDSIADDEEEARERRRKWKNGLERWVGKALPPPKGGIIPWRNRKEVQKLRSDCQQAKLRNVGSNIQGQSNTEVISERFREKCSALCHWGDDGVKSGFLVYAEVMGFRFRDVLLDEYSSTRRKQLGVTKYMEIRGLFSQWRVSIVARGRSLRI